MGCSSTKATSTNKPITASDPKLDLNQYFAPKPKPVASIKGNF